MFRLETWWPHPNVWPGTERQTDGGFAKKRTRLPAAANNLLIELHRWGFKLKPATAIQRIEFFMDSDPLPRSVTVLETSALSGYIWSSTNQWHKRITFTVRGLLSPIAEQSGSGVPSFYQRRSDYLIVPEDPFHTPQNTQTAHTCPGAHEFPLVLDVFIVESLVFFSTMLL